MKNIQILMPMGGLGKRFQDEGYITPKPLIEVDGEPMFLSALKSFETYKGDKNLIFVVRQDAEEAYGLATEIEHIINGAKVVLLKANTRGAVETCLAARNFINPDLPLIVMDCDFKFKSGDYFAKVVAAVKDNAYDGVLLSFFSASDRYSYAKLNDDGYVTETAEKKVISNNALAGAYFFSSGKLFLQAADKLLTNPISNNMKEYYISLLYNLLLEEGKRIALANVEEFISFGTPDELREYQAQSE